MRSQLPGAILMELLKWIPEASQGKGHESRDWRGPLLCRPCAVTECKPENTNLTTLS